MSVSPIEAVTLNLFQGPSNLPGLKAQFEKWMLKRVQHDEGSEAEL